jgi:hypothetical protein
LLKKNSNEKEQKVMAMYAKGMLTRDIQVMLAELYGIEVSPETISAITDKVWQLVEEYPNLIDTLVLSCEHFELPSYSLQQLADDFKVSKNLPNSRAQADALIAKNLFFAMMDVLKPNGKPLDDYIGIYNSPTWPQEGVYLPTELSEAINSGRRLFIKYMDKDGEISERWISPKEVIGISDYIYLQAYCHTRNAERTFRLDRIIEVAVEVAKE